MWSPRKRKQVDRRAPRLKDLKVRRALVLLSYVGRGKEGGGRSEEGGGRKKEGGGRREEGEKVLMVVRRVLCPIISCKSEGEKDVLFVLIILPGMPSLPSLLFPSFLPSFLPSLPSFLPSSFLPSFLPFPYFPPFLLSAPHIGRALRPERLQGSEDELSLSKKEDVDDAISALLGT
jgi:hypothetical protein